MLVSKSPAAVRLCLPVFALDHPFREGDDGQRSGTSGRSVHERGLEDP